MLSAAHFIEREGIPRHRAPTYPSPLRGVSDAAWSTWVEAVAEQEIGAISESGDYGRFAMRVRRLADLGAVTDLRRASYRANHREVWVGTFVRPLTEAKFLGSYLAQFNALADSTSRYDAGLQALPEGLSRSGALALLHRAGPRALESWPRCFEHTARAVERAGGIF